MDENKAADEAAEVGKRRRRRRRTSKVEGAPAPRRLDRKSGGYVPKKDFHPGGHKGKLHRELGVPEGKKIPHGKLEKAMHSKDREVRDDAIRANTMEHWHH